MPMIHTPSIGYETINFALFLAVYGTFMVQTMAVVACH